MRERGYVEVFRRDWPAARAAFESSLALTDATPAATSALEHVQVLQNLATAMARSGDFNPAMALVTKAATILREHPEIPMFHQMDLENYRQDIEYQWGHYLNISRESPATIRQCDAQLSPLSAPCLKLRLRLQGARVRLGQLAQAQELNAELTPMASPLSPRDSLVALASMARVVARLDVPNAHTKEALALEAFVGSPSFAELDPNYQLEGFNTMAELYVLANQPEQASRWIAQAESLAIGGARLAPNELARLAALKGAALHQRGDDGGALLAMGPLCAVGAAEDGAARMLRVQASLFGLNCVPPLIATGQPAAAVQLLNQAVPTLASSLGAEAPSVQLARQWLDSLRAANSLPTRRQNEVALLF